MKNLSAITVLLVLSLVIGPDTLNGFTQKPLGNLIMTVQEDRGEYFFLKSDYGDTLRRGNADRYRSCTFYASSMLMVFIGTNDYERMSRSTGSRMFHLLPYKTKTTPVFNDTESDRVTAVLPGGHRAEFSKTTGELVWIEGYTVKTSPVTHFDGMVRSRGGIEITPEKGYVLIDYGWRTGEIPITQLWRTAVISDGYGNKCVVKMSDLFRPNPKDRDEVFFKFLTNVEFDAFLKQKCPAIRK